MLSAYLFAVNEANALVAFPHTAIIANQKLPILAVGAIEPLGCDHFAFKDYFLALRNVLSM